MAAFQNMTRLLIILALLIPLSAHAGELRIVACTDGLYAVQERSVIVCGGPGWQIADCTPGVVWRTLPEAPGCCPMDAARRIRDDELAWRNRPPAPQVIEPVQVVE